MKTKLLLSAFLFSAVLMCNGQWSRDSLSQPTIRMAGATLGTKAFFAGGVVLEWSNWVNTDKVEIYDLATHTWQMDFLTEAREYATGVNCGDKVFFAGGMTSNSWIPSSRVDIYNSLGFWEYTELSVPRFAISAVSNDSLVLFAGGGNVLLNENYDVVDIFNIHSNEWSLDHLSAPRGGMGCAVAGDLAFFAGGDNAGTMSDRVDIYHFSTGAWDTATLSQARNMIGATAARGKVIFAGGMTGTGVPSDRVDIYDTQTGVWDTASISFARGFFNQQSVTVCGKAYFVGGSIFNQGWDTDTDTIDVYDPLTNIWLVMTMPNRLNDQTVITMDSSMLIAGGWTFTNYPYGEPQRNVEIFKDSTCIWEGIKSPPAQSGLFKVYPNPSSGNLRLEILKENHQKPLLATIYNMQGQVVFTQKLEPGKVEFHVNLADGIYLLNVITNDVSHTELIAIEK